MKPIPEQTADFIKRFEVLRLEPCVVKKSIFGDRKVIWTIGYGHLSLSKPTENITEAQASAILKDDIFKASRAVLRYTQGPFNDDQFTALISFVVELGIPYYKRGGLRRAVNARDLNQIKIEFLKWPKEFGDVSENILKRRRAEANLFLKGLKVPSIKT